MLSQSVASNWDAKPMVLASGPNEAQALDVSLQKNSVRDSDIKRWICSDLERSTLHRVWAI